MSHQIIYQMYSDKQVKSQSQRKKVQDHWDGVAAREDAMEGCTGLLNRIEWKDGMTPFSSIEEAREYIEERSNCSFYLQIAVPVYKYNSNEKLKELQDKLEAAKAELEKAKKPYYSVDTVKAKYVGCKHCGSKLAVSYIKSNKCPLCGEDLRPQSVQDKMKRLAARVKKLESDVEAKKKRLAEVYWLVKVEYHV